MLPKYSIQTPWGTASLVVHDLYTIVVSTELDHYIEIFNVRYNLKAEFRLQDGQWDWLRKRGSNERPPPIHPEAVRLRRWDNKDASTASLREVLDELPMVVRGFVFNHPDILEETKTRLKKERIATLKLEIAAAEATIKRARAELEKAN